MKGLLWENLGVNACYFFKKFNAWSSTVVSHCIVLNTTKLFTVGYLAEEFVKQYYMNSELCYVQGGIKTVLSIFSCDVAVQVHQKDQTV